MHYLLDTGVWVRAVTAQHTVPTPVLNLLLNRRETFGLSGYSLWEVGKKVQKGKLAL